MLCSLPGESDGASTTTSPCSRCAVHTVDQGGQRYVPDQRGQVTARYRISLRVLSCREDALNNQHCNRKHVCTMVQHVWGTTRNSNRKRPTVCRATIRRHVHNKWNIKHTTTSPRYPQSNGLIDIQVRTVKGVIQKCAKTGNDMLIALQQHRCTPLDSNMSSPREIRFNRPLLTTLPSHHPTLMHQNQQHTNEQLQQRIDRMIRDHGQRARPELSALHAGQNMRILNKETHHWSPGEIVAKCTEPRSYIVQTPNGTRLRRTRSHLRELQAENIISEATEHTRRRVTFREDNSDEQQVAPPVTTSGEPPSGEAMPPAIRRSGRMIRKPSRFQE